MKKSPFSNGFLDKLQQVEGTQEQVTPRNKRTEKDKVRNQIGITA